MNTFFRAVLRKIIYLVNEGRRWGVEIIVVDGASCSFVDINFKETLNIHQTFRREVFEKLFKAFPFAINIALMVPTFFRLLIHNDFLCCSFEARSAR